MTQPQILTDEEIVRIGRESQDGLSPNEDTHAFARAIEQAVIAKLASAEMPEPIGELWEYKTRGLTPFRHYTLPQLQQYGAACAARMLSKEPVAWFIDVTTDGKSTGRYEVAAREHWGDTSICIPLYTKDAA